MGFGLTPELAHPIVEARQAELGKLVGHRRPPGDVAPRPGRPRALPRRVGILLILAGRRLARPEDLGRLLADERRAGAWHSIART